MNITKNVDTSEVINEKVLVFSTPAHGINKFFLELIPDKEKEHIESFHNIEEFFTKHKQTDLSSYGVIYFMGGEYKTSNQLVELLVQYNVNRIVPKSGSNTLKKQLQTLPNDKGFVIKHMHGPKKWDYFIDDKLNLAKKER